MSSPDTRPVVLVVEDEPHSLSGYLEFLTGSGYAASGYRNGAEALTAALETVPDVVVTDIAMPGLDGFGLTGALRADQRTKHVPIIGMTARWSAEMQNSAHRAGFSAMLLKPCLPDHLLAEIERVLRHARMLAEAVGRDPVEMESAVPFGLRNLLLRRRAAG